MVSSLLEVSVSSSFIMKLGRSVVLHLSVFIPIEWYSFQNFFVLEAFVNKK